MTSRRGPAFACAIDPAAGLAYVRMWGIVTGSEMLDAAQTLHQSPDWQPGFDAVWDCSAVRSHDVVPADVEPLVSEEVASGEGRDVLVCSPSTSDRAVTEMIAAFCRRRGKEMTVHASLDEALGALGYEALPEPLWTASAA
ncbi:MAG TPA: hypothetical protein VGB53_14730 [Rubricoccaceae bacterium]|jgi:hypothetical protein